jgi:hypothetical protein
MSGAITLLPLYAFTAQTGKTLPSNFFNDGISSSYYMAYNGKITGYLKNVHGQICLQGLRKSMKILRHDSWYIEEDLNLGTADYAELLSI